MNYFRTISALFRRPKSLPSLVLCHARSTNPAQQSSTEFIELINLCIPDDEYKLLRKQDGGAFEVAQIAPEFPTVCRTAACTLFNLDAGNYPWFFGTWHPMYVASRV